MTRSFFFVEFLTSEGWQVSPPAETLRVARSRALDYARYSQQVRIMRGCAGGELVEAVR